MGRVKKHLRYIFKYPGIIPRSANNYLQMLVLRRKRLRGIEFALNWECQCNCEHCSAFRFKESALVDDRPLLTTDQVISVVHQCLKLGAMNINLTGGESLLCRNLVDIVKASKPKSNIVSVATNGILLTREMASELAHSGVRIVTISLDSADPATHDRIRGYAGCFERVLDAVRFSQEADIEVFLCTILTRENVQNGDIYRMVELSEKLGTMLTINLPCPIGSWANKDVLVGETELRVHDDLLKRPNVRWEGISNYLRTGCPAGVEKLYISPAGDVMPCPFIHISYGNLAEEPLVVIWERILSQSPFNQIHDKCLAGQDENFIDDYLKLANESKSYPIHFSCWYEPRDKQVPDSADECSEDSP